MTDPNLTRDPERDVRLAALLSGAAGDAPEADWEAMRSRITAQAELPLARLRRPRARFGAPVWVSLAAAASVAALALTLRPAPGTALPPEEQRVVQEIVDASLPPTLDAYLSGEAGAEALVDGAIGT